jgi:RNA:NAD 2'-phosphotransferase (TPT1/KptA family)
MILRGEKFDYDAYKQARLEEIAFIIRESGRQLKLPRSDNRFDDVLELIEKLKREYKWLELE